MIRESAQLLATAHRVTDGQLIEVEVTKPVDGVLKTVKKKRWVLDSDLDGKIPQATHVNHPCAAWVRISRQNYIWLLVHFEYLLLEYTERYGKVHFFQRFLEPLKNYPHGLLPAGFTVPPSCMKDEFKIHLIPVVFWQVTENYRNFYIKDKVRFAKWKHPYTKPVWWPF